MHLPENISYLNSSSAKCRNFHCGQLWKYWLQRGKGWRDSESKWSIVEQKREVDFRGSKTKLTCFSVTGGSNSPSEVDATANVNATRLLWSRGPPLFIGKRVDTPPRGFQPITGQEVMRSPRLSVTQISGCFLCASALGLSAESLRYGQPPCAPQLSSGEFASVPLHLTRFLSSRHGYLIGFNAAWTPVTHSSDGFLFLLFFALFELLNRENASRNSSPFRRNPE